VLQDIMCEQHVSQSIHTIALLVHYTMLMTDKLPWKPWKHVWICHCLCLCVWWHQRQTCPQHCYAQNPF